MATFHYLAKRGPRETVEGDFEAEDRTNVLAHLVQLGYTPVRITEAKAAAQLAAAPKAVPHAAPSGRPIRIPVAHLNQFTRQFASLIRSQVPLLRALGILREQTASPRLQHIVNAIIEEIRQGQTLSDAFAKYPSVFSPLYVNLTRAGELAGMLDAVFDRLAVQADREESLRSQLQSAFIYPAFVGLVGMGTVVFLLTFVMPRLVKLFQGFGSRLPLPTRILLAVSHLMSQWWFWVIIMALAIAALAVYRVYGERLRVVIDRVSLRLPLIGQLIRELELARFARAFGLLLDHGIPILRATEVAVPVVRNRVIQQQMSRLSAGLKEGTSVAACFKALPVATPFVIHTIAVGEEGGRVGEALIEIANFYERELERLLHVMSSLLEPLMILAVGSVVGFIVMAVLLPIFEMSLVAR